MFLKAIRSFVVYIYLHSRMIAYSKRFFIQIYWMSVRTDTNKTGYDFGFFPCILGKIHHTMSGRALDWELLFWLSGEIV